MLDRERSVPTVARSEIAPGRRIVAPDEILERRDPRLPALGERVTDGERLITGERLMDGERLITGERLMDGERLKDCTRGEDRESDGLRRTMEGDLENDRVEPPIRGEDREMRGAERLTRGADRLIRGAERAVDRPLIDDRRPRD